MTDIRQIIQLLMTADGPHFKQLTNIVLREVCDRVGVPVVLLFLTDGTKVVLKDAASTLSNVDLDFRPIHPTGLAKCCDNNKPVVNTNILSPTDCPLVKDFADKGFKSYACIPLCIKSTPCGSLNALSKTFKTFTRDDVNFMLARGRRLMLALHHMVYFPEMARDWTDFAEMQAQVRDRHRVWHTTGNREQAKTKSTLLDKVLARQGVDSDLPPSKLGRLLPKGISLQTLERICNLLEHTTSSVSRQTLVKALGVSDITAGHYLSYLVDAGVMDKHSSYGTVGRPSFVYVLSDLDCSKDEPSWGAVDDQ